MGRHSIGWQAGAAHGRVVKIQVDINISIIAGELDEARLDRRALPPLDRHDRLFAEDEDDDADADTYDSDADAAPYGSDEL